MAEFPTRPLGTAGEHVSAFGLGGWHLSLSSVSEAEVVRIARTAIDRGINFLDNAWDNGGESLRRAGKALKDGYRDRAFVMTKVDGRDGKEATRQLDESLRWLILRSNTVTAMECLRYALSLPPSVVITGVDRLALIDQAYEAATLPALTPVERQALLTKTARAAEDGAWEPFKTSTIHDSTVTHPEWLGQEPERVRNLL